MEELFLLGHVFSSFALYSYVTSLAPSMTEYMVNNDERSMEKRVKVG